MSPCRFATLGRAHARHTKERPLQKARGARGRALQRARKHTRKLTHSEKTGTYLHRTIGSKLNVGTPGNDNNDNVVMTCIAHHRPREGQDRITRSNVLTLLDETSKPLPTHLDRINAHVDEQLNSIIARESNGMVGWRGHRHGT